MTPTPGVRYLQSLQFNLFNEATGKTIYNVAVVWDLTHDTQLLHTNRTLSFEALRGIMRQAETIRDEERKGRKHV